MLTGSSGSKPASAVITMRAIRDAARERPDVIVEFRQRHDAANAREPVRRLEPRDAAARGRETHRRGRVGAERGGAEARRDGGCRAARRAAGVVVEIPRIVHGPVVRDGRRAAVGELVHVELAEEHRARVAQLAHALGVLARDAVRVHRARRRRQNPGRVDVVLQRERNAVQRPAPLAARELGFERARLRERLLGEHRDVGVHLRRRRARCVRDTRA